MSNYSRTRSTMPISKPLQAESRDRPHPTRWKRSKYNSLLDSRISKLVITGDRTRRVNKDLAQAVVNKSRLLNRPTTKLVQLLPNQCRCNKLPSPHSSTTLNRCSRLSIILIRRGSNPQNNLPLQRKSPTLDTMSRMQCRLKIDR